MKNFEKYVNNIANSLWRYNYGVKNGLIPDDMLNIISFDESWSGEKIKNWLMEEVEEEKIKVSDDEYDLLVALQRVYGDISFNRVIQADGIVEFLVNHCGRFKSIEPIMNDTLANILDKVEVAVTTSILTYHKNGDISFEAKTDGEG